jgi:hypothetical protein
MRNGIIRPTVFNGLVELNQWAMGLDRAEARTVLTQKEGLEAVEAKKYKGIWNIDTNSLACIAGKDYAIVQHDEVVKQFVEVLQTLGLNGNGHVRNMNDRVEVKFLFDGLDLIGDDAKGIKLGVRIVNSYNKTHCLHGELYAWRVVCSNGMMLGDAINGIVLKRIHTGEIDVRKEMRNFLKAAIDSSERLKKLVSRAMEQTLEWDYCKKILGVICHQQKYKDWLEERMKHLHENGAQITRWDIYNLITELATHGDEISFYVENYLQRRAQLFLQDKIELPVEVMTE